LPEPRRALPRFTLFDRLAVVIRRRRRSLPWWAAAAALTVVTAVVVTTQLHRVAALASQMGTARLTAIAVRDLPAGTAITAADIEWQPRPIGQLPRDALAPESDYLGDRTTVDIAKDEPILARRLAPKSLSAVAARVAAGRVGIAVPITAGGLHAALGDIVSLYSGSTELVHAGVVVETAEDRMVVSVSDAEAGQASDAVSRGQATIALRGN
jgi:hypothetical protein